MVSQRTTKTKTSKVDDTKPERIDVQVTTHQKALFARAAQLSHQTLTDFIIAALNAAAARVVRATRSCRCQLRIAPHSLLRFSDLPPLAGICVRPLCHKKGA